MNYYLGKRKVYKCSKCYTQFSVKQGTIFEKSTLPLTKWFLAAYLFSVSKRGVSSVQLAKYLGVKQPTAWYILRRLREAMKNENQIKLFGEVEADETMVGPKIDRDLRLKARKYKHDTEQDALHGLSRTQRKIRGIKLKRGRKKGSTKEVLEQKAKDRDYKPYNSRESFKEPFEKGVMVLGMLERNGRIVLKNIGKNTKDVNAVNVHPILKQHISKDAIFITDEHKVYIKTSEFFKEHQTVNHQKGYVINGIHSNGIENVWGHLKRMVLGTYFHFSYQHAEGYLNENSYRWNRQNDSEQTLFEDLILLTLDKRITYEEVKIIKEDKLAA